MSIRIYGGYKSWTRDSRARWLLAEVDQAYDLVQLDVFAGAQRQSDYLAVNPLGKVPFLEEDGTAIFESGAILAHLADKYAPALVPALASKQRAEYYQWLFYAAATVEAPIVKIFVNRFLFPSADGAETRALQGINEFAVHARLLSERLSTQPYLLGESFSAADIMIGTALIWAEKGAALKDYPVLEQYLKRLAARPAFARAIKATSKEFDGYPGK